MKGSALLWAGLIALFVACLFFAYAWIDRSISLDHASMEAKQLREDRDLLARLLADVARGTPRATALRLVSERYGKDHIVKEEDGSVLVDGIVLRFEADRLSGVAFLDQ